MFPWEEFFSTYFSKAIIPGIVILFCSAEKSEAFRCFQDIYNEIFRDTGKYMQIFCTDGGGEFNTRKFQAYLFQKGIRHETTAPYPPKQKGFRERDNRTVMESVRSLLYTNGYLLSFWAKAYHTIVYTGS